MRDSLPDEIDLTSPRSSIRLRRSLSRSLHAPFRSLKSKWAAFWAAHRTCARAPSSVFRDDRAARRKLVVHADLDLTDPRFVGHERGAVGCERSVPAERQIVVLGLGRPVLAEVEMSPSRKGGPIIEAARRAHGRRKFFDLARLTKAPIAAEAVKRIDVLFAIERAINGLAQQERLRVRQERSRPLIIELQAWLRERTSGTRKWRSKNPHLRRPKSNRSPRDASRCDAVSAPVLRNPTILSRDEYPFACRREGGRRSWVGHIPLEQNSAQGGALAAFLRKHHIQFGQKFLVKDQSRNRTVTSNCKPSCSVWSARCRHIGSL